MPEVGEASNILPISEYPYAARLDALMGYKTEQIRELAFRGLASFVAKRPDLEPRAQETFRVVYNVFLQEGGLRHREYDKVTELADEEKIERVKGAQVEHKMVDWIWSVKNGVVTGDPAKPISTIVSVTDALTSRDSRVFSGRDGMYAKQSWSALKTELAVIETFTKEGWKAILPDHQQPFDPKSNKWHEVYQQDMLCGVDTLIIVPTQRGMFGLLLDMKTGRVGDNTVQVTEKDQWLVTPMLNRTLNVHRISDYAKLEVRVGKDCFLPYKPTDPIEKFGEITQEARSGIITAASGIVRDRVES